MDVILLKDVEKVGTAGSVVHVKPGFARNYLCPAGLAVPATPQQLKMAEAATRRRLQGAQKLQEEAEAMKQRLEGRSLTLKLTLGEDDKPFGSVTAHDLVEALSAEGLSVEKHAIQLEHPLKALGVFDVPVRLHPSVAAILKVWIVKA
jgi:large subunit ribosomal protein L9